MKYHKVKSSLIFESHYGDIDFIEWMLYKANFSPDVNRICEQILNEYYGK